MMIGTRVCPFPAGDELETRRLARDFVEVVTATSWSECQKISVATMSMKTEGNNSAWLTRVCVCACVYARVCMQEYFGNMCLSMSALKDN